ncbi:MAG: ferrous iron transporter B [Candidatus Eisenbacteria bacterium]|uniref:Ferrous iron transporter B n=1 Tax=Eiseniibacteriota bacterium TaxID=2212470 RepID=A0A933S979_UNCEI|nr:ferrous iron transporter B [Candidatus Eisenbacteria bacterium]
MSDDCCPPEVNVAATGAPVVALVGNPNAGKTTLFNQLTGMRAKTANYPGTTVEHRSGLAQAGGRPVEILDLPGLYALDSASAEERLSRDALTGAWSRGDKPQGAIVLLDATNLERSLGLVSQMLELDIPIVVALNMIDLARRDGIRIDVPRLATELQCPVVPVSARTGEGVDTLREAIASLVKRQVLRVAKPAMACDSCAACSFSAHFDWAERLTARVQSTRRTTDSVHSDKLDEVLTHPVVGPLAVVSTLFGLLVIVFWGADMPMSIIDWLFGRLGDMADAGMRAAAASVSQPWLQSLLRDDLRSLVVRGLIGGLGGVLVFLPQIGLLFFALALLEDTGYLARATFVVDRLMRRVGLPAKAFVPLLSAHACAVPAILSARTIEDERDRFATMFIAPLMSCSARIPVYTLVIGGLLFPGHPWKAAAAMAGAYGLGAVSALLGAMLLRRTALPGGPQPLVLEMPRYRWPSLRTALWTAFDRMRTFVQSAGSLILIFSLVLWALAEYPRTEPSSQVVALRASADTLAARGQERAATAAREAATHLHDREALEHSFAGRFGHLIEPAIAPLGFNWQIGLGLVSSLAAREVIVSTLIIVYGAGDAISEDDTSSLSDHLKRARREDDTPLFTLATSLSLLIFYVLALQCTSTLAIMRRETGSWKWPALQFVTMTGGAYLLSLIVYQALRAFGIA